MVYYYILKTPFFPKWKSPPSSILTAYVSPTKGITQKREMIHFNNNRAKNLHTEPTKRLNTKQYINHITTPVQNIINKGN